MFLRTIILTDPSEIKSFRDMASKHIGVHFPLEYLGQGIVRAFIDVNSQIMGGYALISKAPLRTIRSIPSHLQHSYNQEDLLEVTAMWLSPDIKSGFPSFQFWYQFSRDVSSHRQKKYFVYSYTLANEKLRKLYALAKPSILYQGKVKKLEGCAQESVESVEVASRRKIAYLPLYAFPNFLSKALFRRKTYFRDVPLVQFLLGKT